MGSQLTVGECGNSKVKSFSEQQQHHLKLRNKLKSKMGDYKVYLGNIPDDTRDRDVEKLFKSYGRIRNVVIKRNEQGTYGFCEFDDMRDAQDAVKILMEQDFLEVESRLSMHVTPELEIVEGEEDLLQEGRETPLARGLDSS